MPMTIPLLEYAQLAVLSVLSVLSCFVSLVLSFLMPGCPTIAIGRFNHWMPWLGSATKATRHG